MDGEGGATGRLALGLVLAVVVSVGGGIVLSGWADDGASPETVGAIDRPGGRAATTSTAAAPTAPTTASPPTTSSGAALTTTVPGGGPSATRAPAATTTTLPAAPREASPTTSTTVPGPGTAADGSPWPACTATMFDTRLTLERTTYRPGETVRGTATFTNVSGNTCWWASSTGKTEILDAGGRPVTSAPVVIRDGFHWIPFTPGEVFSQTPTWDQQACPPDGLPMPCGQAPAGSYTMVVTEQPYGVARAPFRLVAT